jgi:hypothetical protein
MYLKCTTSPRDVFSKHSDLPRSLPLANDVELDCGQRAATSCCQVLILQDANVREKCHCPEVESEQTFYLHLVKDLVCPRGMQTSTQSSQDVHGDSLDKS